MHQVFSQLVLLLSIDFEWFATFLSPLWTPFNLFLFKFPFPFYPHNAIAPNYVLFPGNRTNSLSSLFTLLSALLSALCPLLFDSIYCRCYFAPLTDRGLCSAKMSILKGVLACTHCDISRWPEMDLFSWMSQARRGWIGSSRERRAEHGQVLNVPLTCRKKL